jgi:ribosome-associated protein
MRPHASHTDPHADTAADDTSLDTPEDRPSKTQLKKAMQDLQDLGKALMDLNDTRLDALELPDSLRRALRDLRVIRSHEGRRRQIQLVGKLMRQVDPEPLREAVAVQRLPGARETLALHETEAWRDRLIGEDAALTDWLVAYPATEAQALRALIRNARKEALQTPDRKGRAYREIFQLVRASLNPVVVPDDEDA